MAPGQAYRDERGRLLLFCREETRKGVVGYVLAGVGAGGVLYTRFYPTNTVVPAELVNDTTGRAEAELEREIAKQVEAERDALVDVLNEAERHLSESTMEELRMMYLLRRR